MKPLVILLLVVLASCRVSTPDAPATAPAVTAELIGRGLELARTWCSECHRVEPPQPRVRRPREQAPPFMAIAADPAKDEAYLDRFMQELHLPMPTFRLWPTERAAMVAYIHSLAPAATR